MENTVVPIDIQIQDVNKFALVAYLVDKDAFLSDLKDIRDKINLPSLPYDLPRYPIKETESISNWFKKGLLTIGEVKIELEEICRKNNYPNVYPLDKTLGGAVLFAEALIKKYDKNRVYFPVILASIMLGKVTEDDFSATHMIKLSSEDINLEIGTIEAHEDPVAIIINRESTLEEMTRTYDFIQKYYFKTKKNKSSSAMNNIFPGISKKFLKDTTGNVKRDRKWYWLKKNGWLHKDIKKNYFAETKNQISVNGIEQAIRRYSKAVEIF